MSLRAIALEAVAMMAVTAPLRAQSSAEVNAGIQYNFSSPGAHSLARAGAFIADASDATAAYTNPAGLVNVAAREVSFEARSSDFLNTYSARGHAFGPPSNIGNDTISGIQTARSSNRVQNISFASFVLPLDRFFGDRRVTIAAYRHELANFTASQSTNGVFFDFEGQSGYRLYPAISSLRLRIAGEGMSIGLRATDRISLGIGMRRYQSSFDSITRRFLTKGPNGGPDYSEPHSVQRQRGDDHTFGMNAGLLFDISPKLSLGATLRRGFSFPVAVDYTDFGAAGPIARPTQHARFNVPSFYGLGASIRPTDDWSVAVDVNRITYSDTTRHFVYLFQEEPRYFVPDGTEIRIGSELTLTRDRLTWLPFPIYVAAGTWRDPDHSIRAADPDDSQAILFRKTSADIHVTGGVGMLVGTRAQFHVAIDRSSRQTVLSLSAMARF
jgi:long-chain fatty acid transport protein